MEAVGARRPRIAQICGAVDGAKWMVQLSHGLRARGYDVVAVIGGENGSTAELLERSGLRFVAMPQNLGSSSRLLGLLGRVPFLGRRLVLLGHAAATLRRAVAIATFLRREQIDIAHAQIFNSIVVGRVAAFLARVPIRLSMVPGPYHLESPLLRRIDLATERLDTLVIGGSQRVTDLYLEAGLERSRVRTIPYGCSAEEFDPATVDGRGFRAELGIGETTPLVGQVAYFYQVVREPIAPPSVSGRGAKGHEDFLAAASIVVRSRPDARFVLVGGGWGPEGEKHMRDMQRLCRELALDEQVTFTGPRSDVPEVLAALDVSVQCSLNENYGGTIESLLMERPTVATRVGGMPETVRHEETGLLVPPRDPPALARAMLRLIDCPELGRALGRRGRELMLERFTVETMTNGVADLYAELLSARRQR